jgi:antitoxin ParD1/3/4
MPEPAWEILRTALYWLPKENSMSNLNLRYDIRDWIESRVRKGEFATAEDYVSDLVERDRDSRSDEERLEELRKMVEEAEKGDISARTAMDRVEEGRRRLRSMAAGNG